MTTATGRELGRARASLRGLAVGDALGMPTQLLDAGRIRRDHGGLVAGFTAGPADHPVAAGLPAGTVTDDTEQAVIVGRLLVAGGGHVAPEDLAVALRAWERDVAARGVGDLLGPSTRAALAALAAGVPPAEAGSGGITDGAAMRVAPVGIAVPPAPGAAFGDGAAWGALVDRVVEVSLVTHNTSVALAAAAAVAAAVSAGVAGGDEADARAAAVAAARAGAQRGRWVAGGDVAARIAWAAAVAGAAADPEAAVAPLAELVGTSVAAQEAVPAAFGVLAAAPGDPWLAVRLAASLGGDTDTIAAIVGAVAGACAGEGAWPSAALSGVRAGHLDLDGLAAGLVALRAGAAGPAAHRERRRRVVVVGQAVLDVTAWLDAPARRGGDTVAAAGAMLPGGAFNTVAAAARQGATVLYAGHHGTGPAGDAVRAALAAEGAAVARTADPAGDTGFVATTVEPGGERTFVSAPGAVRGFDAAALGAVPVASGDVVCVSGYGLAAASGDDLAAWVAAIDDGVTVIVDPGPLVGSVPEGRLAAVLARADWWTSNAAEAEAVTGERDPRRSATALHARRGGRDGVIVRDGAAGCVLMAPRPPGGGHAPLAWLAAPPVDVVDTTGAGDTHVGVFAAGLAAGADPHEAARRATVAAALSVTRRGPATAPTAAEVEARTGQG